MTRRWKAGDVAAVPMRDGTTIVALRRHDGTWRLSEAHFTDGHPVEPLFGAVRPLLVLDPDDHQQMARLADAFCEQRWSRLPSSDECDPLTRSSMSAAVRSLLESSRPPEPHDPGCRVTAHGEEWAHVGRRWVSENGDLTTWDRITDAIDFYVQFPDDGSRE